MRKKTARTVVKTKKAGTYRGRKAESDLLTSPAHSGPVKPVKSASGSLGQRIRAARQEHGLTVRDISSRTGIDEKTLKFIESDELTPPLGQLVKLGKALDMKMGYFISPGVQKPITVTRQSQRRPVARYGEKLSAKYGYTYESLAPEKADRAMEPFIVRLMPTKADESSTHDGQEFIYVLDGRVKVQVGTHVELLDKGDAAYYDSNRPHVVKAAGQKPATILAVIYTGMK